MIDNNTSELSYLTKNLEDKRDTPTGKNARDDLFTPLGQVIYGNEGEMTLLKDNIEFDFAYGTTDATDREKMYSTIGTEADDFKRLTRFSVRDRQTDDNLDFFDRLPSEYKVYFNPAKDVETYIRNFDPSHMSHDLKMILIWGDIATPRAVIVLAHEVGHTRDQKSLDRQEFLSEAKRAVLEGKADPTQGVAILEEERFADAQALRMLRPFIHSDGIFSRDAISDLQHNALGKYSNQIRKGIGMQKVVETKAETVITDSKPPSGEIEPSRVLSSSDRSINPSIVHDRSRIRQIRAAISFLKNLGKGK